MGNKNLVELHSPRKINKLLTHKNNLPLSLAGPADNLKVIGVFEKGYSFNDLLPLGVKLGYSDYFDMVTADFDRGTITFPSEESKYLSLLPYALFHAITRATLYQDKAFQEKSRMAHGILRSKLSHLQGYGHINQPTGLLDREVELDAWQVVGEEERLVTLKTIEAIAQLALPPGRFNVLPQIRNIRELDRLVNGYGIKRTRQQVEIELQKAERRIGVPITVTGREIQGVLDSVGNSNLLFS